MQDAAGAELVCNALAAAASTQGAAVIVLGRDPALVELAQQRSWRRLALTHGRLEAAHQIDLAAFTVDEIDAAFNEAEVDDIPNVVPFPLSARTAGVA